MSRQIHLSDRGAAVAPATHSAGARFGRIKASLAPLAADAALTRPAHSLFIGNCRSETPLSFLVFMMTASVVLFTALAVGKEYPQHLRLVDGVRDVILRFTAPEPSAC